MFVQQVHEMAELFGFETRNKYQILDSKKELIGYAAEQQKGILGFLFRQYLGHWRTFEVHFFNSSRQLVMVGYHPFRWFFKRIEIRDESGKYIGALQKRFAFFTKRFDVEDQSGVVVLEVASPIWRLWTFTFMGQGRMRAEVRKKWSGILFEGFTDKDNFMVDFSDPLLSETERTLVLASAVFIDLLYFETKAGRR